MPGSDYPSFFSAACGPNRQPYGHPSRLAYLPCESRLITF